MTETIHSLHDKHDEEVKRLKEKYPDLKHLFFAMEAGSGFIRTGYLALEEKMVIDSKDRVSETVWAVIEALGKIEDRAFETRETLLKECNYGQR